MISPRAPWRLPSARLGRQCDVSFEPRYSAGSGIREGNGLGTRTADVLGRLDVERARVFKPRKGSVVKSGSDVGLGKMSLSDSSDSTRGRSIPVHKRKMVWSSSDGPEASSSDRPESSGDAESSSGSQGRGKRPPAADEAGVSRWQDMPEPPVLPEVKGELVSYDPEEGVRLFQLAIQGAMAQKKKRARVKKTKKPDPPGSTLSTPDSLRDLKARFNFSEGAFSSMDTMVHSYDSAAREHAVAREQFDAARAEAEKKVAEAVIAVEAAEAQVVTEQEARRKEVEESVRAHRKAEAEIERLKRLLVEEKALRETEVARARKAGERKIAGEFVEKVRMTEAKLAEFDKVSERYVYFSQAKANAELIDALEAGGTIEEEKLEVAKWKEEFGDAEAEYARLGAELLGHLKIPPVSPDSTHDGLGNRSVESEAAEAGVLDQAGTNLNSEAGDVPEGEQDE
ncbi:hypothetical protein ISN45_Aa03g032070 [Arabidopsis thaliana x Arabidopsis arenosa]|uniref:Uncharacterized protein n=1 Tax=Arabidopsis thaliana x Arabidopsis arenosa TaxID=1240361 RepID=A0A8T2B220_9BRAS|nr:hypothetical protein ISN45_Aa03g032070 [Arabidopsis thaliana x Arabidopsis arenosa]